MSMRQAVERANTRRAAKETAVELRSTGRARAPVATWTLPLKAFAMLRRRAILAGHLRDRAWGKTFQEFARACGVVLLVGRKHDQEETIFRCQRETGHIEDGMVGHGQAVQGEHAEYRRDAGEEDGHFERDHDESRPRMVRLSADVQRVGDC